MNRARPLHQAVVEYDDAKKVNVTLNRNYAAVKVTRVEGEPEWIVSELSDDGQLWVNYDGEAAARRLGLA